MFSKSCKSAEILKLELRNVFYREVILNHFKASGLWKSIFKIKSHFKKFILKKSKKFFLYRCWKCNETKLLIWKKFYKINKQFFFPHKNVISTLNPGFHYLSGKKDRSYFVFPQQNSAVF